MPKLLQKEIDKLKKQMLCLGTVVEESVREAVKAIHERDIPLAEQIIHRDEEIDKMEVDLEEECLKVLALYQPVAIDLRFIIAILKINNDLERIGDLAVNIAERVKFLASIPERPIPFDFDEMSEKVQVMLHHSLDALVNMSPSMAVQVCEADDEVDALHRDMYKRVEREMKARPEDAPSLIPFLGVAWRLERIGDHATNIAEDVIYMIEGEIVRHRLKESGLHGKSDHGDPI